MERVLKASVDSSQTEASLHRTDAIVKHFSCLIYLEAGFVLVLRRDLIRVSRFPPVGSGPTDLVTRFPFDTKHHLMTIG